MRNKTSEHNVVTVLHLAKCHEDIRGHPVAQLVEALRYSRKVAGSIPDGLIGIFH